ncbi:GTPase Era [Mycoplasma sp. 1654_15]|uniref:GTPase Era n=1 Tax=Mycoplasma sp. 1654_15 TaxID=2725994 RepID=UPI001448ECD0|nr:GTPase Era [Mycoplasma sp. 1654_15]QJB71282.1 GTPase Era [Mycoplasma sp. 1654_15]
MKTCFVSIIGLPNSGKSTMLNNILDYDLSIVSYKPQTTRDQINGIYSEEDFQIVFVDTPGFQNNNSLFSKVLNKNSISSLDDIDLVLFLHPVNRKIDSTTTELAKKVLKTKNKIAILTKIDLEDNNEILAQKAQELKQLGFDLVLGFSEKYQVSKQDLLEEIKKYLYESENYFDTEFLTDRPMRFLAKEIIRKHLLLNIKEEIPHQVAIVINDFIENYEEKEQIYITSTIYVAKKSHIPIVIGKNGAMLEKIGKASRLELEDKLGQKVILKNKVKESQNWLKDTKLIKKMGY